jgi:hypothetical protein
MNVQTSNEYPTRPIELLNRSAEAASRVAGLAAFGLCLGALLYFLLF